MIFWQLASVGRLFGCLNKLAQENRFRNFVPFCLNSQKNSKFQVERSRKNVFEEFQKFDKGSLF